jgi:DNA-binding MarR family transcriptional regulator
VRDLFAPAAPPHRDTSADDAQRRAAKAAKTPLFAQAPTTIQTLTRKAEQMAAEAERATRDRITARRTEPTLDERKSRLPQHLAAKCDAGLSVPAAELLTRIALRQAHDPSPIALSPSSIAKATGCTDEEAQRQIGELQAKNLILEARDVLGRRGFRLNPDLGR